MDAWIRTRTRMCSRPIEHVPIPMGPKCPLKMASLKVLMSGIHRYRAITMGSRRRRRTRIAMTIRRHTESESSALAKSLKGIHAPTKTKAATLNSKSMTDENTDSSVCLLKKPSQAKAAPQQKAARRSSDPRSVVAPIVSNASETYWATYDCRSMRSLRSQNFMR